MKDHNDMVSTQTTVSVQVQEFQKASKYLNEEI